MTSIARPRRYGFAVALAVVTMTLAGCGASSIANDSYAGFPAGADGLGGSSSCPTVPTAIEEQGGELVVTVARGWVIVCTADMVVTTYELSVDSVPGHVVVDDGEDRRTLEVVPL